MFFKIGDIVQFSGSIKKPVTYVITDINKNDSNRLDLSRIYNLNEYNPRTYRYNTITLKEVLPSKLKLLHNIEDFVLRLE